MILSWVYLLLLTGISFGLIFTGLKHARLLNRRSEMKGGAILAVLVQIVGGVLLGYFTFIAPDSVLADALGCADLHKEWCPAFLMRQ